MKKLALLFACIVLPLLVGGISGYFTIDGVKDWYVTLNKPSFTPPNWLFGPVWTCLYLLMGIAFYRALQKSTEENKRSIIGIFALQLFFNFWWSILFFHFHTISAALIDILILWICILLMIIRFRKSDAFAGYSQIPYILWVSFATALTLSIWWLN